MNSLIPKDDQDSISDVITMVMTAMDCDPDDRLLLESASSIIYLMMGKSEGIRETGKAITADVIPLHKPDDAA